MRQVRALMLGVALLALVVACVGYVILNEIRSPASEAAREVEIEIPPGSTTSDISNLLRTRGLIRQPLVFNTLVRFQGLDQKLQAGRYVLRTDMTISQILVALQNSRVEELQVTIKEGVRLEEIAETIANTGVVDEEEFLAAARNGEAFKSRFFVLNSLPEGASLEGYLFPDTYRIASTATVTEVISLMLNRFNEQYTRIETEVRVPNVTVHQVVTMASVIQREAALLGEMPRISAVFWNRLKPENAGETGGGKLQADPTVQYILGAPGDWWPKIDQLPLEQINGAGAGGPLAAYNTRVNNGAPPGPIASPGFDALKAAAQPDESAPYLYFVADCAKDGSHNFAVTFEDFDRFANEWAACQ
ncbi:MAG: endolytic transglycosylase MltG [Chloroflexaceae bacterium]|jgi:UPF0755 protein|nr:endolytic transglycosylase MltG [Chloroflexaceae bacterium]